MRARNRVGIELSYRPARLHRLTESIPWNRFLGSSKFKNTTTGYIGWRNLFLGIDSWPSLNVYKFRL
jgi:hypothetical protein